MLTVFSVFIVMLECFFGGSDVNLSKFHGLLIGIIQLSALKKIQTFQ